MDGKFGVSLLPSFPLSNLYKDKRSEKQHGCWDCIMFRLLDSQVQTKAHIYLYVAEALIILSRCSLCWKQKSHLMLLYVFH